MAKTWIVVSDSARARIFAASSTGNGQEKRLEKIQERVHASSRSHERELASDARGRAFDSEGPGRHAMSEKVSPKEHEAWKLCKELADEIERSRAKGEFDRLVLVAAPAFLGELRKKLSEPTRRCVVKEVDKDLAGMSPADISRHVSGDFLP